MSRAVVGGATRNVVLGPVMEGGPQRLGLSENLFLKNIWTFSCFHLALGV